MPVERSWVSTAVMLIPCILLTSFTCRCHVIIRADNMSDIVLHVELDVTGMSYTAGNPQGDQLACIIFKVSLNRSALWAQNGSKCFDSSNNTSFDHPLNFLARTWRGEIGIMFDCTLPLWDIRTYRALIKSLASCFVGKTIQEKTYVICLPSEHLFDLSWAIF
jgi:hypothetical protein